MSYRTILAVTGPEDGDADIAAAAEHCEAAGAHLSVFVVQMAAPPPVGEFAAIVSDVWMQERQEDERILAARLEAVTAMIAGRSVSADVSAEYCEMVAADEAIGRRARYTDLTLVGPQMLDGGTLKEKIVEGVLYSSGRPLLLVPANVSADLRPKRVMVAWDSGLEAARALREALPMLTAAEEVVLTLVDPVESRSGQGAEPGADAATYLARHGAKVTVDRLPAGGRGIAETLKRHAVDRGADMMVMGAYGHSRLREHIFGGVTKTFLDAPPLPVFLAR